VVAPTRELVLQIYEVANKVGVAVGIRVVAAVGGVGFEFQQRAVLEVYSCSSYCNSTLIFYSLPVF
jgi:superfamily II DNA/RNA helicase